MKFRVLCRKLYDYVRYDLKEIAFPSSLPDPPHIKKRPKLSWNDRWCILKEATRLYAASWVRDIGPDLRPNDYKKAAEEDEESPGSDGGGGKKGAASPACWRTSPWRPGVARRRSSLLCGGFTWPARRRTRTR